MFLVISQISSSTAIIQMKYTTSQATIKFWEHILAPKRMSPFLLNAWWNLFWCHFYILSSQCSNYRLNYRSYHHVIPSIWHMNLLGGRSLLNKRQNVFSPMDYTVCLNIWWSMMNIKDTIFACFYYTFFINDTQCQKMCEDKTVKLTIGTFTLM